MKKSLVVLIFLLTAVVGIVAVFLGSTLNKETNITPETSKAQSPINCELDLSQANPKADINMGNDNNGPYPIPQYCPGDTGKMKVNDSGRLLIYTNRTDLIVKINGQIYNYTATNIIKTNLMVNAGDYINISAGTSLGTGIGWVNPTNALCGDPVWGTETMQPLLDKVLNDENTILEKQCWGDVAVGKSDFDFNDFQIIVTVEGISFTPIDTSRAPFISITQSITDALRPTLLVTATTVPSITAQVELDANVKKACGVNSLCNSSNDCQLGNSCINVSGKNRCVANVCLTNNQVNSVCQSDYCTPNNEIKVNKEVVINCVNGQNQKQLNYTIILTNPATTARSKISVVDRLDASMKSSYVIKTSIPYNGQYRDGAITWSDLNLTANGGRLEIKYIAIVPASEYGKEYLNSVTVSEDGIVRGGKTISTKIAVLPCTALISDQADIIILGIILTSIGLLMYISRFDQKIGQFFWYKVGKDVYSKFNDDPKGKLYTKDKADFEKKLRKK